MRNQQNRSRLSSTMDAERRARNESTSYRQGSSKQRDYEDADDRNYGRTEKIRRSQESRKSQQNDDEVRNDIAGRLRNRGSRSMPERNGGSVERYTFRPGENRRFTDEEIEAQSLSESHRDETRERRYRVTTRIVNIILIVLCCYMVLLIFGVGMTDYQYSKDGKIRPAVMSVSDIREKAQFSQIKGQYDSIRELYKKILLLDYRMAQGHEDQKKLATEYQTYLDMSAGIATKIKALSIDTKYNEIKTMMYNWSYTYMPQYIQYMASAILQDNSDDANEALAYKDDLLTQFTSITQSLASVGDSINGVDITDMTKFNPNTYAEDKIKGKVK